MKSSVGLGLRHSFHGYVLENKPAVPFFEVISENYMDFDGAPRSFLRKIRENYPLIFHGVSLSIGSLEPVRLDYLTQLKKMIAEFQPLWVSDHLCWTYNGPENSHDLLPVPFTKTSLERIISKTLQVQEFLGQKIYLENPSAYVDFKSNEFSEEDFISELCKKSGCGLLLDLNNLVVNQYNLGYKPSHYLNTIQNCDVKQIHLAGHTIKENVRIDTHDSAISQEVLDLIPLAKHYWPEAKPMIEWDDKIPPIENLLSLRESIDEIWFKAKPVEFVIGNETVRKTKNISSNDQITHQNFWNLLKTEGYIAPLEIKNADLLNADLPTPAHIGMNVYSSAYYNRLLEVLEKTFPVLKLALNDYFNDVALEYLKKHPSTFSSIDFIGQNLANFIADTSFSFDLGVNKLILSDIAKFEASRNISQIAFADQHPGLNVKQFTEKDWLDKKIKLRSEVLVQRFNSAVHNAVQAFERSEAPEIPDLEESYYVFYRNNDVVVFQNISKASADFLNSFAKFKNFTEHTQGASAESVTASALMLFENENLFCVATVDHI